MCNSCMRSVAGSIDPARGGYDAAVGDLSGVAAGL
jgi:hypothetical protein